MNARGCIVELGKAIEKQTNTQFILDRVNMAAVVCASMPRENYATLRENLLIIYNGIKGKTTIDWKEIAEAFNRIAQPGGVPLIDHTDFKVRHYETPQ